MIKREQPRGWSPGVSLPSTQYEQRSCILYKRFCSMVFLKGLQLRGVSLAFQSSRGRAGKKSIIYWWGDEEYECHLVGGWIICRWGWLIIGFCHTGAPNPISTNPQIQWKAFLYCQWIILWSTGWLVELRDVHGMGCERRAKAIPSMKFEQALLSSPISNASSKVTQTGPWHSGLISKEFQLLIQTVYPSYDNSEAGIFSSKMLVYLYTCQIKLSVSIRYS